MLKLGSTNRVAQTIDTAFSDGANHRRPAVGLDEDMVKVYSVETHLCTAAAC
jgi:hypothetical protein